VASTAQDADIRLQQHIPQDVPEVYIDKRRIMQVLLNLLSNALKFTSAGGEVMLRASHDLQQPGLVLVSVSDTGRGIEPEQLGQIFDRLYQVRSGDATIEGGLGLGLYICREIIKLHGGDIWVESMPGKGSTFFFTIPTHNGDITLASTVSKEIAP
jgi:signal transduction histidine kinase